MKIDNQITLGEVSAEYQAFVDKFKPKKTTDDCYTPEPIYKAVLDYCVERYGIDEKGVVRPFWPGADYRRFDYPDGCTVIDNPPFSIISRIVKDYNAANIRFFLFAPYLTNFGTQGCTHVITDADVTYENGAVVKTAFLTNLEPGILARSEPNLREKIASANVKKTKTLEKYVYPDEVLMSTDLGYMSAHGISFEIRNKDAVFIRAMDAQKRNGKTLFGGGYLLSERAAAERAAAERAAREKHGATVWELSEREREIVRKLGK